MNRLTGETSPYLRQHRDNPIDWYPWGDEPFDLAREQDRPVLLSIGYSSCHWCHVMAHESFENPDIAELINRLFVSVKVDREERPDVDAIYMEAVQSMTGSGGWPMTVFLTPDRQPFYAGTYYPPVDRGGLPSLPRVLEAVSGAWHNQRDEVLHQAARLRDTIDSRTRLPAGEPARVPGKEAVVAAAAAAARIHDPEWGGFGRAPKFPQTALLELLTRAHLDGLAPADPSASWLQMLTTSLDAMASGGIYDHVGGGFSRYSVDRSWLVPHFEKMLYDQASLARAYLHAWMVTGRPAWLQVTEETIAYALSALGSPDGGFYSSEDADSEGEEGRFYLWSAADFRAAVGTETADAAASWYGVTERGNFEGRNILHRPDRGDLLRPPEVERARRALAVARAERSRPALDDKVLTEWTAMMTSTLAEAGGACGRPEWTARAERAGEFLSSMPRDAGGRWLRSWQAGRARHLAVGTDHAWMVDCFTRLAEATGRARWIDTAREVADAFLSLFWDEAEGGFFTTGSDAEQLIVRSKDVYDGSTPSAISVGAVALLRLSALTGSTRYREAAEGAIAYAGAGVGQNPLGFAYAMGAVSMLATGTTETVVTGDRPDLVAAALRTYVPDGVLAWGEPYGSPLWEARRPGLAFVCHDHICREPTGDPAALVSQLSGRSDPPTGA